MTIDGGNERKSIRSQRRAGRPGPGSGVPEHLDRHGEQSRAGTLNAVSIMQHDAAGETFSHRLPEPHQAPKVPRINRGPALIPTSVPGERFSTRSTSAPSNPECTRGIPRGCRKPSPAAGVRHRAWCCCAPWSLIAQIDQSRHARYRQSTPPAASRARFGSSRLRRRTKLLRPSISQDALPAVSEAYSSTLCSCGSLDRSRRTAQPSVSTSSASVILLSCVRSVAPSTRAVATKMRSAGSR